MLALKTALIGAASAACLIAGAVLAVPPAKADAVLGDVKSYRPDPAYVGRGEARPNYAIETPRWQADRGREPAITYRDDGFRSRDRGDREPTRRDRGLRLDAVEASGSIAGDLPRDLKRWRAERIAIEQWKREVADIYGRDFARWRFARDKETFCDGGPAKVVCTVRAIPTGG